MRDVERVGSRPGSAPRASEPPRRHERALSALEIGVTVALYFVAVWCLGPLVRAPWARVVFYALLLWGAAHVLWISPRVLHRDRPEVRGWGTTWPPHGLRARLRIYGALTLLGGAALLGVAALRDPGIYQRLVWRSVWVKLALYVPFAFVQDMFVFAFIMTRVRDLVPARAHAERAGTCGWHRAQVTLTTAAIFALLHAPNGPLMAVTALAGLVWAWVFYARPSIALLALSHAILGTVLHRVVELNTRVGPFYWQPKGQLLRVVIPGMDALIGDLY